MSLYSIGRYIVEYRYILLLHDFWNDYFKRFLKKKTHGINNENRFKTRNSISNRLPNANYDSTKILHEWCEMLIFLNTKLGIPSLFICNKYI